MTEHNAQQQCEEITKDALLGVTTEALLGAFDILDLSNKNAQDALNIVQRLADGIISTTHEIIGVKTIYAGKILSVDEIIREYQAEPEAAKARYEDKKLTVTGIIESQPLEQRSGAIVVNMLAYLNTENTHSCSCVLPPWYKNLLYELRPGRRLTVTGIWWCINDDWEIAGLNDCGAVSVEDTEISEEMQKHLDRIAEMMESAKKAREEESEMHFLSEEEKQEIQSLIFETRKRMTRKPEVSSSNKAKKSDNL